MGDESAEEPKKAPVGWYPHPSMANTQRYWDGQKWTNQVSPLPGPDSSRDVEPDIKRAFGVLALSAALAVLGLAIRPEDPDAYGSAGMNDASSTSLGGAAIFALIGLVMLARALMKSDDGH